MGDDDFPTVTICPTPLRPCGGVRSRTTNKNLWEDAREAKALDHADCRACARRSLRLAVMASPCGGAVTAEHINSAVEDAARCASVARCLTQCCTRLRAV